MASCFYAVASEFVPAFAEEYYQQHEKAFADYPLEQWNREAAALLSGCQQSYVAGLSVGEQEHYTALGSDKERDAFRIAQSLARLDSDATVPPPLFFLSCGQLAARIGLCGDTPAMRILRALEARGIIETVKKGTLRAKGQEGIATVYRWMQPPKD